MMRLKQLLTLLILATWQISKVALSDGSSVRYVSLAMAATVLLAAVFVLLRSPTRGREDAFELESSFLLSGPPALATILSAGLIVLQMKMRNNCGPFWDCSRSFTTEHLVPIFILALVSYIFIFLAIILAASFIALLIKTTLRFRSGMAIGCAAFRSLLRSRRLKCALAVAAMIGWYAPVIMFELSLTNRLLLAVATAFTLAVLLLALPAPGGRADRSISELGKTFLLAGGPALATLIVVHVNLFGLDDRHAELFLDHDSATIIYRLHFLWVRVALAAMVSLEFYAIVLLVFLFIELIWKIEQFMERKTE